MRRWWRSRCAGTIDRVITDARLDTLDPEQLRQEMRALLAEVAQGRDHRAAAPEALLKQATIDKLTHEMAVLKRMKFAATSEAFNPEQRSLLEDILDEDLAALTREIEQLDTSKKPP